MIEALLIAEMGPEKKGEGHERIEEVRQRGKERKGRE